MGEPSHYPDFSAMSISERIALAQAILDSIAAETEPPELTEDQKREFDRRIADLDANPDNVLSWEEIKAKVRGRP